MQNHIRKTRLYREVQGLYRTIRRPGLITDAAELHGAPDGAQVVFAGTTIDKLEGIPATRICRVDLSSGQTQVLTSGPNSDRLPKYSPDGQHIAFLSDRRKAGDFQLYFLDVKTGAATPAIAVEGWIEYLHWSPDGGQVLLGVAGHGADVAGGQGAVTSKRVEEDLPAWLPTVETGDERYLWRSAWVYDVETASVRQVSKQGCNIWEAVWCGPHALAAVVSPGPGEGLWYTATLNLIDIHTGEDRVVYQSKDQLGWPAATPSGDVMAVVEAVCSDRWIVAGDLLLIDPNISLNNNEVQRIDTKGVDITHAEWRSDDRLLLAGQRSLESVMGEYDRQSRAFTEIWASEEISCGCRYPVITSLGNGPGDCLLVGEGFLRSPEIARVGRDGYHAIASFDQGYTATVSDGVGSVGTVRWPAPDGQEIHGWLMLPEGKGPYPLVMYVHGGPVWQWRPAWLARSHLFALILLKHGYAVFWPNPRGSGGRGQDFARMVYGDVGGAETYDHLSGLDYLVEQGIADPKRLGVIGASHGGFMTSWLITQDPRFAAAVPVAPVTDWVSQHLVSNIPFCDTMILDGHFNEPGKHYFQRSPIMHAHKVKTPTLNICGALDRCTPPEQAVEFHHALLEHGIKSMLVTYPEEGHGVRKLPAMLDYTARVVAWFEEHMPAEALKL